MLEITGLTKVFNPGSPNEVRALESVDLTVQEGSFIVVIGSNGSGKSTLLNAVAGTVPTDSGSIRLAGNDITDWPEHRRASLIGRVFQNPFSGTAPSMTVAENLSLATRRGKTRGLGFAVTPRLTAEFTEQIRDLRMGLENRLSTEIGILSGGQRQALTLLMATYLRPSLLLLDEHTAALDPRSAEQIVELTDRIVKRDRLTVMMVTHSMNQAVAFGDRLIMMHRGKVVFDVEGEAKKSLQPNDLLEQFDQLRRREHLSRTSMDLVDLSTL